MKKAKQLREERKVKFDALAALIEKRKTEKRDFTEDEQTQFDTLETEIDDLDGQIERAEKVEKMELRIAAASAGNPVGRDVSEKEEKDLSKYSLRKVLKAAMEGRALEGLEAEMHEEGISELQRSGASHQGGLIIPEIVMQRLYSRDATATGGTGGDQGGLTIPNLVNRYVEALRERSLLLQLGVGYMSGLTGNFDDSVEDAVFRPTFKSENADSDKSNPTFKKVSWTPHRLAGHMDLSKQLVIQSAFAIESRLRDQMLRGLAEALDDAGFNGSGQNNEPLGILNDSDISVHPIGTNGGAITQEHLDALEVLLRSKKQYSPSTIVTNAKVRRVMRNAKIDEGSGLFLWDRKDNTVDGKRAFDTTHVPDDLTKGTSEDVCSALIEGVFQDAYFGQWGGTEIMADPYTQGIKGMIRLIVNQYVDFNVVRKASFAMIKDITTA